MQGGAVFAAEHEPVVPVTGPEAQPLDGLALAVARSAPTVLASRATVRSPRADFGSDS